MDLVSIQIFTKKSNFCALSLDFEKEWSGFDEESQNFEQKESVDILILYIFFLFNLMHFI